MPARKGRVDGDGQMTCLSVVVTKWTSIHYFVTCLHTYCVLNSKGANESFDFFNINTLSFWEFILKDLEIMDRRKSEEILQKKAEK